MLKSLKSEVESTHSPTIQWCIPLSFFSIPIFCMVSIIFLYFKVKTLFKHCFVMLKLFIDFIFNDYLIFWPMIYHNILTIFLLLDVLVVINVFLNKTFLYLKLVSLGVGNQKNVGESYEHKTNKKKKTCYLLPDCFSERLLKFVLLPSNNVWDCLLHFSLANIE